jgi:zinc protease
MKKTTIALAALSVLALTPLAWAMTTVELPVPTDPTVSFRIMIKTGSQNDPAGKEGVAALTANMISDGSTTNNSYDAILKKLYPMSAGYGASVDKEITVVTGRVHKDHLDAYVSLLVDAIVRPAFTEADFERHKTNTLNYLDRTLRYSNDEAFGKEMLYGALFAGTPYEHPTSGLPASVRSITLDDVKAFYKSQYTTDNIVIGLGGGFDAALVDRLKKELSALPAGAPAPVAKATPRMPVGKEVVLVDKETQSTAISIGYPFDLKRGEKDFYALWIANSWLGEHRNSSSHLYQVIRETRGMNYGDYSYIEYYPNGWRHSVPPPNSPRRQQFFEVWLRPVPNEQAHFALRAALREVQKLIDNGMTQEDFDLTKKFLKKYIRHYAPTTDTRLGYKLDDAFYGVNDHLATAARMFDEVTLADVNAAVRKYLQADNLYIAMISGDAEALKQALGSDVPSPMTYENPKPESVVEEDKVIATYPLKIDAAKITVIPVDAAFAK